MEAATLRRLGILIATLVVLGAFIFFAQRYQVGRMDRSILSRAAESEQEGNFAQAAAYYQEHLEVVPNDQDVKQKLADVLLKGNKNSAQQDQAIQLYAEILTRRPAAKDIRRRLAEALVDKGRYKDARLHLELLLKSEPENGVLCFLLGRCQEAMNDDALAAKSYQATIKSAAPERVEASRRLAIILRGQLNMRTEADRVIDEMVRSDPSNYRVYLERGRYHRRFADRPQELKAAKDDFEHALAQVPEDPKVYVELAGIAQGARSFEEGRQVLKAGLKAMPKDPSLHQERAILEARAGSLQKAIATMRQSLEVLPEQAELHATLGSLLADHGDTSPLLFEIEVLKRASFSPAFISFLEACYLVNSREWKKASQALNKLQPLVEQSPEFTVRVNALLARCYEHLGDRDRQRDAYRRSHRANPQDVEARLWLAADLADRGEIDQSIDEYRRLASEVPHVRAQLVRLLIARNLQRSAGQKDWSEVESMIKAARDAAPGSSEWIVLQASLLLAQNKLAESLALLDKARLQFPKDAAVWAKSAEVFRQQRKFGEALALLDQARQVAGDTLELRVERSRVLCLQGGSDVPQGLLALAQNTGNWSRTDRRRLLETLAAEAARLNDLSLATTFWNDVAKLDPNDLDVQQRLLRLAFLTRQKPEIEHRINEIKRIDGADSLASKFADLQYMVWQARTSADRAEQVKLRGVARSLISDLSSRRPDWPFVPLALADLVEQELEDVLRQESQPDLSDEAKKQLDARRKRLIDESASLYLRAIELGQRTLDVIHQATDRLYAAGRSSEVAQLWSQLPAATLAGGNLQQQVLEDAVKHRDFDQALELARKAKAANPYDLRQHLRLAQVLIASQRQEEAEAELREAVDQVRSDPDRWVYLVGFLVQTKQLGKAEKAFREAESVLKSQSPLGLAKCSELLAQAYKAAGQDDARARHWYDVAARWYKAVVSASVADPMAIRRFIDFLLRSGQLKDAQDQLTAILEKNSRADGSQAAEELAWARRTLIMTLLISDDYQQKQRALTLVEPIENASSAGPTGARPGVRKPEDLRVLSRVYEAQGTPAFHQKAREALVELVGTSSASADDRFLLARMLSADGDWNEAHREYQNVLAQTEYTGDLEILIRRPEYIAQFISDLLNHYKSQHDEADLAEAQELVDKLKVLRPYAFNVLAFQARIFKAQGRVDKAIELIIAGASRPNVSPAVQQALATLAEEMGKIDLAEQILRQLVAMSDRPSNRLALAGLLSRQGRTKDALDQCEKLWNESNNPEELVAATISIALSTRGENDSGQLERVALWLQKGLERIPGSSILTFALGNLRERQGMFQEAEALYRQDIERGRENPIALNNLAWLMALRKENNEVALDLINRAIKRYGPSPEFLDTRGVIYLMSGDSQHAIDDLSQATISDPSGSKYLHLAEAYLHSGNKEAAAQTLVKARSKGLKPDSLHPLEVAGYQRLLETLGTR
jgi:tetratricopeptide (TPR) repeat protein